MEFIRKHTRWLMVVILALTAVAFIAPQGYTGFMDATTTGVASVDGQKITQAEWDAAHRQASERLRQQNPQIDAKLLDSDEAKRQALEGLVQQRLLAVAAQSQHLEVANERLEARFQRDPELAFLRNANGGVNPAALAAQGMSKEVFIERLRQDLRVNQVMAPVIRAPQGGAVSPAAELAFDALLQRRELRLQRFEPQAFAAQVQLSDADIESYYQLPATQKRWQRPEAAQIEYLVLDLQGLKATVSVNEAELRSFYEQNASRYSNAEERRARHILLKLEQGADAATEKAVTAKAEQLLAQLRKEPAQFAELARKESQDEGSAINGGDLDFFTREAMVKPFADAAFALKVGEISPIVRSEFGLHIIQLEAVRGGERRAFEAVRAEIEDEQRTQLARQRYQELAENFSTLVFEQPDSLQPAAEKLGLSIQQATVQRQPSPQQLGLLASPKLLEAVFSAEALRNKRNTDAVETAASQLVAARVLQHQPAAAPPLIEVREAVRQQLLMERAAELANKAGAARLAQGLAGPDDGLLPAQWVSRAQTAGLPQAVLDAVLRADTGKLPALIGLAQPDSGYWLIKLEQVAARDPALMPAEQLARQYDQAWAQAEGRAYLEALKQGHKVKINAPKPAPATANP
jgi:peptidyl-prolyl cis-trans isomerase D